MITITTAAAEQIRAAMADVEEGMHLRIAAREVPGGVEFGMGLDEIREHDMNFNCEGVDVLLGPGSRDLVVGLTLDFVEYEPGDYRFIFIPPATSSSCGTGGGGGGGCGGCGGGCGSSR